MAATTDPIKIYSECRKTHINNNAHSKYVRTKKNHEKLRIIRITIDSPSEGY